ncbi:MAG: hypothetical protein R3288_01420 [Woeseiaceae bacterium]|nr:hypothetical protein [Woeseiaceae bacterium]
MNRTVIPALSPRTITLLFACLVGAEVFFVLADHFINVERWSEYGPIRRFFNITREDGVASWFAVTQTWMVGLTAGLLALVARHQDSPRWRRVGWLIISLFLMYMAMDDGAEFHERIGSSVKAMVLGDQPPDASRAIGIFPSYTWQLVFLPIFGAFGLFLLWFLNRELDAARDKLLVVAAIGLLVLAVVADFFEGLDNDAHPLNLYARLRDAWGVSSGFILHYSKSIEEFFEMLSMSLLWLVFLRHLTRSAPVLELHFASRR